MKAITGLRFKTEVSFQ